MSISDNTNKTRHNKYTKVDYKRLITKRVPTGEYDNCCCYVIQNIINKKRCKSLINLIDEELDNNTQYSDVINYDFKCVEFKALTNLLFYDLQNVFYKEISDLGSKFVLDSIYPFVHYFRYSSHDFMSFDEHYKHKYNCKCCKGLPDNSIVMNMKIYLNDSNAKTKIYRPPSAISNNNNYIFGNSPKEGQAFITDKYVACDEECNNGYSKYVIECCVIYKYVNDDNVNDDNVHDNYTNDNKTNYTLEYDMNNFSESEDSDISDFDWNEIEDDFGDLLSDDEQGNPSNICTGSTSSDGKFTIPNTFSLGAFVFE